MHGKENCQGRRFSKYQETRSTDQCLSQGVSGQKKLGELQASTALLINREMKAGMKYEIQQDKGGEEVGVFHNSCPFFFANNIDLVYCKESRKVEKKNKESKTLPEGYLYVKSAELVDNERNAAIIQRVVSSRPSWEKDASETNDRGSTTR